MMLIGIGNLGAARVAIFSRIGRNRLYWGLMSVIGLGLEGVALYYQYVLNQYPCVLCIHIRLWVLAFIVVGAIGAIVPRNKLTLGIVSILGVVSSVGMLERSWQTLATEKRWIEGSCSFSSGLPSWFALDQWFPWIFGVQASCGYTPVLPFGVTMAEALMAISVAALITTSLVAIAMWRDRRF